MSFFIKKHLLSVDVMTNCTNICRFLVVVLFCIEMHIIFSTEDKKDGLC